MLKPDWLPDLKDGIIPKMFLLCGGDLLESFSVPGLWQDDDVSPFVRSNELFEAFEFPAIFFPCGVNGAILVVAPTKAGRKHAPTASHSTRSRCCMSSSWVAS
jgi:hypothetical protein